MERSAVDQAFKLAPQRVQNSLRDSLLGLLRVKVKGIPDNFIEDILSWARSLTEDVIQLLPANHPKLLTMLLDLGVPFVRRYRYRVCACGYIFRCRAVLPVQAQPASLGQGPNCEACLLCLLAES